MSAFILVVDDDEIVCNSLSRALQRVGYRAQAVQRGWSCLDVCRHDLPDLILMDVAMPEMSGLACCDELHDRYGDRCPPIVMLTGSQDTNTIAYAFELGVVDYITKPVNWTLLQNKIRTILSQREQLETLQSLNLQLQKLVPTDLTLGIATRASFLAHCDREWSRQAREELPLSVVLLELDEFTRYAAYVGELGSQQLLQQIAALLRGVAQRATDVVARFDGACFSILLPNTPLGGCIHLAKLMQQHVNMAAIPHPTSPIATVVTCSIGLTSLLPDTSRSAEHLVWLAQRALDHAKADGGDRIVASRAPVAEEVELVSL